MIGVDILELCAATTRSRPCKHQPGPRGPVHADAQALLTNPLQYGVMPNLGLYSKPDGPMRNWSELLPLGKIDEARDAQGEAAGCGRGHGLQVADAVMEAGADGIDMDTTGAAGDADFLAALAPAARYPREIPWHGHRDRHGRASSCSACTASSSWTARGSPACGRESSWHGRAKAGASIYGPAVNINTGKSTAWNIARAITFIKPATEVATIPVHVNVGMGVGGVPTCVFLPADAICRASQGLRRMLKSTGM